MLFGSISVIVNFVIVSKDTTPTSQDKTDNQVGTTYKVTKLQLVLSNYQQVLHSSKLHSQLKIQLLM